MRTTRHAVATENYICWLDGHEEKWHMCPIWNVAGAWEVGQLAVGGFTHLWVFPNSWIDRQGTAFLADSDGCRVFPTLTKQGLPKFASIRKEAGHQVYIGYPHRGRWAWTIEQPHDILETVKQLEEKTGVPCEWSPAHMGADMLKECWAKKPQVLQDASFDLRELPFNDAALVIDFRRALTEDMIGQWVHHFDKNSDFMSAARSTKNGIGDPVHITGNNILPGLPGIYKVQWSLWREGGNTFDGVLLPTIIDPRQEWITNDVLEYAMQNGYGVKVLEAWVFEDYQKIIDPLALRIWTARKALKGVNANAYATMKGIAVETVGMFAASKLTHPGIEGIHPNWWADVVGKSRVCMLANLKKYSAVAGAPVCVDRDSLFFVSRDSNYRTAVPGILDRHDALGGYKHEGSCVLTPEMYNAAATMNSSELATMFEDVEGAVTAMDRGA